ncbi:molybdenum ABC transporter ATP-binding protein [Kordiimonas pumila]|uniref:Molybdenum ABC transporter ATP-binding protein n=1 Tax=Kordiimonas pumila TaxID=2161677 RepID=A0ABV7CZU2_9PROT|nr:molybdenum ABC transporter ATP-binding protein [Kordiimonas pumila]
MTNKETTIKAAFNGTIGGFSIDIAFDMPTTGITALFGASGSGKTTILRAVAGLHKLEGSLCVEGDFWQDSAQNIFLPAHKRPIGYVFQEASLFPHLSVRQNLLYGAKRTHKTHSKTALKLEDITGLLRIGKLLDRSPLTLSGGERQRVAVGRALLSNPSLLLMDEPLSALDQKSREEVLSYFETLHKELSIPILYVSHDFAEVSRLADHMVLISGGQKQAEGPAREVFERLDFEPPAGRFETSVMVKATIVSHTIPSKLSHMKMGNQMVCTPLIDAPVGSDVMLRIRARDVAVATQKPVGISIRNILAGTIIDINSEANSALVELLIDIDGSHIRSQITNDAYHDLALETGKQIFALVKSMSFGGATLD